MEKVIKTGKELFQEKLAQSTIEMEVNNQVELIRSVIMQVRKLLLNDPNALALLDIKDHFDLECLYFMSAYDKLVQYLNDLHNEKS